MKPGWARTEAELDRTGSTALTRTRTDLGILKINSEEEKTRTGHGISKTNSEEKTRTDLGFSRHILKPVQYYRGLTLTLKQYNI